jgi:hypothetical protein
MNRLLAHYRVDVQHPEVSSAEHLEMLQIRDRLAEFESTLTSEEQNALVEADRVLAERANAFHQERLRFLDLTAYRWNTVSTRVLVVVSGRDKPFATAQGRGTRYGTPYSPPSVRVLRRIGSGSRAPEGLAGPPDLCPPGGYHEPGVSSTGN